MWQTIKKWFSGILPPKRERKGYAIEELSDLLSDVGTKGTRDSVAILIKAIRKAGTHDDETLLEAIVKAAKILPIAKSAFVLECVSLLNISPGDIKRKALEELERQKLDQVFQILKTAA